MGVIGSTTGMVAGIFAAQALRGLVGLFGLLAVQAALPQIKLRGDVRDAETREPLDAVLSYGHFTVQNRGLARPLVDGTEGAERCPLRRLKNTGVDVVLNASIAAKPASA